ncbi:MAG: hypothetical protein MK102_05885 [Fuerstiella sp.]|nr:hypothetical protein [Fuerstiella sp.]
MCNKLRNRDTDTDLFRQLNRNRLFYVACRVAFLKTFDNLLGESISSSPSIRSEGFLDRIPLLAGTAPQIQIELLLQTWQTLRSETPRVLTIQEQVICLAITSELAHTGADDEDRMLGRAACGPIRVYPGDVTWLASRVRVLQMMLPFAPQAAILQVESGIAAEDLHPVRTAGGVDQAAFAGLVNLLGGWTVSERIFVNARGLLTQTELDILREFFAEHPRLIASGTS